MANKSDDFINRREYECHIQRRSLEMWLGWLNPIRWLMVSVTTILSALAAATVLARTSLWASHYQTYAGLCALGSAILSGLHTNLRCDPHQSEGSRLILMTLSSLSCCRSSIRTTNNCSQRARPRLQLTLFAEHERNGKQNSDFSRSFREVLRFEGRSKLAIPRKLRQQSRNPPPSVLRSHSCDEPA